MRTARPLSCLATAVKLALAALGLALVAGAAAWLRARYGWRDLFDGLWLVAVRLSRRRLALVLLASAPVVWLVVRRRTGGPAAHAALVAYLGGVLGDAIVLLGLEPLGISYGPVLLPAALLAGVRCIVALGLGLVAWLLGRGKHSPWPWAAAHVAAQALLFAAVVDGFAVEPARLTLSTVAVADPYTAGGRPLRVVQIADLHVERASALTAQVVESANALQPDLIALTGDYLNGSFGGDAQAIADLRALVRGLRARHGIYAISGNTDPRDLEGGLLSGLPVTVLDGRWQALEVGGRRVVVAGVGTGDPAPALSVQRQTLAGLARSMPQGCFSILLYHAPDLVPEAAEAGFDLYLTGHTHGGQMRLPFYGALTTFSLYGKRYEMGAYQVGRTLVYVSRGVGMEGWLVPRMRFLCPPEIVCIDIG